MCDVVGKYFQVIIENIEQDIPYQTRLFSRILSDFILPCQKCNVYETMFPTVPMFHNSVLDTRKICKVDDLLKSVET